MIGKSIPRTEIKRLIQGQGQYVDDITLPRMAHVAFVRSPHAHAQIIQIDTLKAQAVAGVIHIADGREIAQLCKSFKGHLAHLEGMQSALQDALAIDRVFWHGQAVLAIVASTRAIAEDAAELVDIQWEELVPIVDEEAATDPQTTKIHAQLTSNICWQRSMEFGDVDGVFTNADEVIEETFYTQRHTHVTLEPRTILADYHSAQPQLNIWQSTQAPHMMQSMIADLFGIPVTQIRVIAPDVGGSFGLKIHVFGDEMATIALAILLRRPIKFTADRLESFLSDYHARGHRIHAKMAVSKTGRILGIQIDDLQGMGPFASYPRGGINEARHLISIMGAAYGNDIYRAKTQVVFQNKSMYGQYRSVGHPIACLVTEGLVDLAARRVGIDPAQFRKMNYVSPSEYPRALVTGATLENLSQHEALDSLLAMMHYDDLRKEQQALRKKGIYRGIGLASFLEMTNPSSATYGRGGVSISSADYGTVRLMSTGSIFCTASINEFGQGASTVLGQIVADTLGVAFAQVRVVLGDTDAAPFGGDNWASRGTGVGGEAVLQAAKCLKSNILEFAAILLSHSKLDLDIFQGKVIQKKTQIIAISLLDLAKIAYFHTEKIPHGFTPQLSATNNYSQRTYDGICTNGIQASHVEVDLHTGKIQLLNHWVVEDCGRVINPLLVNEQVRGGVIQGIGAALYEQCIYSPEGQLINGSLMDYLVPMASEMPDIHIAHTSTPTKTSELGAKGSGEAGVAGASGAVLNAINDALSPLGVMMNAIPVTPQQIIRAIHK